MNRSLAVTTLIFAALIGGCGGDAPEIPRQTVTYFYEVICCSCTETAEMTRVSNDVFSLGRNFEHIEARSFDIYTTAGLDELKRTAERLGRNAMYLMPPLLIVDDEVHLGLEAIQAELDRLHGR
jgi:hypothetical protein